VKLLAVLSYYHPHWTGLTAHAQSVAEGLASRGHEVTVLAQQHDPSLAREEVHHGVRIVRVRPIARVSRGMIAPEFLAVAARMVREHDVVQIHTPLMESWLVATLCRRMGRPLLLSHHGDLVMPAGVLNRTVETVVSAMMRRAARLADRISAYSRDYAEHSPFLAPFADKTVHIHPPVDIPPPDLDAAARWRAELGLGGKKLIGFAGRFVEEKGFDFLLRALPSIVAREPTAHLVYAGERKVIYERFYEKCRPLLEAQAERVSLLGLLRDRQQLADFYAMCDVFALPSRTDCLALVQVEAMLSGTPVVASDIPGARVAVRATSMGRLVAPHDPQRLAEGLTEVLADPSRWRKSREEIGRHFSRDRALDEYERVFRELVEHRRAAAAPAPSKEDAVVEDLLRNEMDMAFRRRARRLLEYLELRDGETVFDCGCGMGFYLMAMSRLRRLRLLGMDRNRQRLDWARRERVAANLLRGDVVQLPLANASIDKLLMSEILEHLDDDRAGLREAHRVLRPGGVLAVSVPHADYPFLWDPINRLWTAVGGAPLRRGPLVGIWTDHQRLYRPADLAARIGEAGFAVEKLEQATHHTFPLAHFLLYGIGKPLFEHGLLPRRLRDSADRFAKERAGADPLGWMRSWLRRIDRRNDDPRTAGAGTFVNVLVKARKPAP